MSVDASQLPQPPAARRLARLAQLAFFPTGVLTTLLGPMLSLLIARWSMSDTQAGNLFFAQFIASLGGVQFAGLLISRWGYRLPILFSLLLMAAGALIVNSQTLLVGLVAVSVYGLGIGMIVPSASLLISELAAADGAHGRASAVSLLNFFWGVGAVFCALSVAWSAAHGLLSYFLRGVAVMLVVLAAVMRNLPFPEAHRESRVPVDWPALLRRKEIWLFALVFFLYPGTETAVGGWIGSYVARLGPRESQMASVMPAFFWSALTIGRALGTAFLRLVPENRVLRIGYGTALAGITLILWAPSLAAVMAGAFVAGLSFATLYPINVARLSARYGVAARSIGPAMFSLASLGPSILLWLVGVISQASGSLRTGLMLPLAATALLFSIYLFEW